MEDNEELLTKQTACGGSYSSVRLKEVYGITEPHLFP